MGALGEAVSDSTAVVSIMWGNNEVGTLQPIAEAVEIADQHGAVTHSDAVQAVGHVPVDFAASGLDLLSFSAHKLGGPYGIGVLLARRDVALTPVLHGGGQERDVRSGTLDVAAVAGFRRRLEFATERLHARATPRAAFSADHGSARCRTGRHTPWTGEPRRCAAGAL